MLNPAEHGRVLLISFFFFVIMFYMVQNREEVDCDNAVEKASKEFQTDVLLRLDDCKRPRKRT